MNEGKETNKKKIIIIAVCVVSVVLIAVCAILIIKGLSSSSSAVSMDTAKSGYLQYEVRNYRVLLSYDITLKNNSDEDLKDFKIRGVFKSDYASGYILDQNAYAEEKLTQDKLFSLDAGETKTFHLMFYASYYKNDNAPSRELPSIILEMPEHEIKVGTFASETTTVQSEVYEYEHL
ncbi:MAG: hypothetical protein K6F09_05865 [Clostridiales bacterium]|nr:hypothetical protein [Clostridiales bacterium]